MAMFAVGGRNKSPASFAPQVLLAHRTTHPLFAVVAAASAQFSLDAAVTVRGSL
jgi:hypothetical protein